MDIKDFFDENEKPLEKLCTDGGFAGVFRKIGCIGDSLSSGEFQSKDENGNNTYYDMFDFSWGQYLARFAGTTCVNMSRGGMTAKEYYDNFAEANGYWEAAKSCQAFIIALGVNDITYCTKKLIEFGDISDIKAGVEDGVSFIAYYAKIIRKIKDTNPDAHFFLMTIPSNEDTGERKEFEDMHSDALYALAEYFDHCFVMDFRKYAPVYDSEFKKKFFMDGHMNPMGYLLTGKMVASYLDYIVRHNTEKFCQIGFIGTDIKNPGYYK